MHKQEEQRFCLTLTGALNSSAFVALAETPVAALTCICSPCRLASNDDPSPATGLLVTVVASRDRISLRPPHLCCVRGHQQAPCAAELAGLQLFGQPALLPSQQPGMQMEQGLYVRGVDRSRPWHGHVATTAVMASRAQDGRAYLPQF